MNSEELQFSYDSAASNTYLGKNTFTYDWTYNSIYIKFVDSQWNTIELNNNSVYDLTFLDNNEKKKLFITLLDYTFKNLENKPYENMQIPVLKEFKDYINLNLKTKN